MYIVVPATGTSDTTPDVAGLGAGTVAGAGAEQLTNVASAYKSSIG